MEREDENGFVFKKDPKKIPQRGYTKPDDTVRCQNPVCFVGRDEAGGRTGPPLITETISIIQPTESHIEIARVTRCVICFILTRVTIINNAASTYRFTAAGLCRLLKQSRGSNFRLHELQTGKMDDLVEYPGLNAPRPPERERLVLNPNDTDAMEALETAEAGELF